MKLNLISPYLFYVVFNTFCADCIHISLQGNQKNIIIPILKERIIQFNETIDSNGNQIENSKEYSKLDSMFYKVLETKIKNTNEVLAILLGIYFGEHPLEEIECEIINIETMFMR
jgi:hypothetical protein